MWRHGCCQKKVQNKVVMNIRWMSLKRALPRMRVRALACVRAVFVDCSRTCVGVGSNQPASLLVWALSSSANLAEPHQRRRKSRLDWADRTNPPAPTLYQSQIQSLMFSGVTLMARWDRCGKQRLAWWWFMCSVKTKPRMRDGYRCMRGRGKKAPCVLCFQLFLQMLADILMWRRLFV